MVFQIDFVYYTILADRNQQGARVKIQMPHFLRLQSAHSIWQFSATVRPPFDQGFMWSACMSSIANLRPHFGQTPFCRSYAVLAAAKEPRRLVEYSAFPNENLMRKILVSRPMSRLAMERQPYRRGDHLACMKKERTVSFMHSREALPQAQGEYMKRQCAQLGAPSLTCRSPFETVVVFRENDLLALMLN